MRLGHFHSRRNWCVLRKADPIVGARFENIRLVAMLYGPDLTGFGMNSNRVNVLMPQSKDFRQRTGSPREGIAGRDGAVGPDPEDLTSMIVQLLRARQTCSAAGAGSHVKR